MQKKLAITDVNAENSSRDIPPQTHEFEQKRRGHFVGFQVHFRVNMMSQTQSGKKKMKKMKVQYLRSLLFDLFGILQAVRT